MQGGLYHKSCRKIFYQKSCRWTHSEKKFGPGLDEHTVVVSSGSEAGSYLSLIDFVYHPPLGLRVIKKKKRRVRPIPPTLNFLLGWNKTNTRWAGNRRANGGGVLGWEQTEHLRLIDLCITQL